MVKTKIKTHHIEKENIIMLQEVEIGEVVSIYIGDSVFMDNVFMIANNPIEKNLTSLVDLETGDIHKMSNEVLCCCHTTSLLVEEV